MKTILRWSAVITALVVPGVVSAQPAPPPDVPVAAPAPPNPPAPPPPTPPPPPTGASPAPPPQAVPPPPEPLPRTTLHPSTQPGGGGPVGGQAVGVPPLSGPPTDESAANTVTPLAGWNRSFFIRDPHDLVRMYPGMRINTDLSSFFGPGVDDVAAPDGGNGLKTKIFLRRVRLELAGDFTKYLNWMLSVEWGQQPLTNTNGKTETAAGSAGGAPDATTAKFAPVQATSASAAPQDVWINVHFLNELNFMVGQEKSQIGIENRTSDNYTPFMERNIAIRGFVVPTQREIGITAWGDIGKNSVLAYEVGVYGGDGQNRGQIDNQVDGMGRVFFRPFAADDTSPVQQLQVGLSGRYGQRDPKYVGYDLSPITTGQGYSLFNTTYKDSLGRTLHIIPSSGQSVFGGELRVPVSRFAFQGEAYYVNDETREAVDGYQLTNSERFGALKGVGWYAMLEAWPWGDPFISGDPGFVRPVKVDFDHPHPDYFRRGLELLAIVAGIDATYDGASRLGSYDSKTPGAKGVAKDVKIYQVGAGANFWYSRNFRVMFNYMAYLTPGSGSADNLAVVPGNTLKTPLTDAHIIHEVGSRIALAF